MSVNACSKLTLMVPTMCSVLHWRPGLAARYTYRRSGLSAERISAGAGDTKGRKSTSRGFYLTPYERSKADAHQAALAWRGKGLPLIIAMPNAVVGANDHSVFGYFLRLYLLGAMPPI